VPGVSGSKAQPPIILEDVQIASVFPRGLLFVAASAILIVPVCALVGKLTNVISIQKRTRTLRVFWPFIAFSLLFCQKPEQVIRKDRALKFIWFVDMTENQRNYGCLINPPLRKHMCLPTSSRITKAPSQ
jgi:hypothetical protein